MIINDVREMAKKHNVASMCIVSFADKSAYVSPKAWKLAKEHGITILDYHDVLYTIHYKVNSEQ